MSDPKRVPATSKPRMIALQGSVPGDAALRASLERVFDILVADSASAARSAIHASDSGVVMWPAADVCDLAGDIAADGASDILQNLGEAVAVVDATGAILWADRRFRAFDESIKSAFVRSCRTAIEEFNKVPVTVPVAGTITSSGQPAPRATRRFPIEAAQLDYELIVAPKTVDGGAPSRVTTVVGVLWEVSTSRRLQRKLDAIDAAGADLLRIEASTISKMNMGERLKLIEQKIVAAVRDLLGFDNFEIRLLDRDSSKLELVIAVNIAPLKIGETLYARAEGNGISGLVAVTGRSYIAPDVTIDPQYREGLDDAASSLTVPLWLNDRVVGVFNIESTTLNAFDDNDRLFAEIYGRYIAMAMNILNLLVTERFTTNEQLNQNVLSELNAPIEDLSSEIAALREPGVSPERVKAGLDRLADTARKLRSRATACTSGPRSILAAEQEMSRLQPDPTFAGKRILIADDEPAIRETLESILKQKGCFVTVCSDGAETIKTIYATKDSGAYFDLILSDIRMPDCNGYEVFRAAKAVKDNTPVILMTGFGYDPHHSIVRASQEGLQSFLFKPFKISQLIDQAVKMFAAKG